MLFQHRFGRRQTIELYIDRFVVMCRGIDAVVGVDFMILIMKNHGISISQLEISPHYAAKILYTDYCSIAL